MRRNRLASVLMISAITASGAYAQDHFTPALANIRDWMVPEPGLYGVLYNYGMSSSTLNDVNGNPITSVTLTGPGGRSTTLNVDANLDAYALAPMLLWAPHMRKILGARYGAFVVPSFTNVALNGLVSAVTGAGLSASTGQFNAGDLFVQPLWLDWSGKHYDLTFGYGFYIPSGSYKIATVEVPGIGELRTTSPSNTGLGFWENQNQGSFYYYPWADKRMAIETLLTWEINQKKRAIDITPGQHLSWNWGLSEYLPLKKDKSALLEVGPAGYLSYQVADDRGTAVANPGVRDHVDAAGLQVGVTWPKQMILLNFHYFREYSAAYQFQGNEFGLNLTMRLKAFGK